MGVMMCYGLRDCVGMDFKGKIIKCNSNITLNRRIKLFILHIRSLIRSRNYKGLSNRSETAVWSAIARCVRL